MSKYISLQIPEACHEKWQNMSPDSQGRFCGSCQKKVIDFTQMSDAQLVNFFKQPQQSTCGRFTPDQLNRDMLIPTKKIPWAKYFLQITLPAFLLSLKSMAQVNKVKTPVEITSSIKMCKIAPVTSNNIDTTKEQDITVRGTVRNIEGNPIAYASIVIKGTNTATATDSAGNFILKKLKPKCSLVVSSVGFEQKEVKITGLTSTLEIVLPTPSFGMLGEVVVVGYAQPKKKEKKIFKKENPKQVEIIPELTIYPNPIYSTSILNLHWKGLDAGNYAIEVYNTSGILIQVEKQTIEKGVSASSLSLTKLLAGNYYVRMKNERNGKQVSQQFIVKE